MISGTPSRYVRTLALGFLCAHMFELLNCPLRYLPLLVEWLAPLPLPVKVERLAKSVELLTLRREITRIAVVLSWTIELTHPPGLAGVLHNSVREGKPDGLVDSEDVGDAV